MRILGVDPGLRITGYAVIEQRGPDFDILDAGVIRIDPHQPLAQRLRQLQDDMNALLDDYLPQLVAVEELYAHYAHPKTAILMGHARGIFLAAAAQHHIDVQGFTATRVKKSLTGNGRAAKHQVQKAITTQLNLPKIPSPPDVADALAIAMCCANEHAREKNLS